MANLVKNEIECISEAWDALDEIVQSCRIEQLTTLGRDRWSIKDHLAHIAGAEQFVVAALKGSPVHDVFKTDRNTALVATDDELNEIAHRFLKPLTEAQVLDMRDRAHRLLMDALAHLSDGDLTKPFAPYGEPMGMTMLEVLRKNTYEHYDAHRGWLEDILNLEASL